MMTYRDDDDDRPPPVLPPVRAIDTGLSERVASGVAGAWEARQIDGLLAWLRIYERALRHIAVHGDPDSAMLACRVMAGDADAAG